MGENKTPSMHNRVTFNTDPRGGFVFDAGSTTQYSVAPAYDGSASAFIAGYGTGHGSRDGRYVRSVVRESAASGPPTGSTAAFSTA